MRCRYTGRSFTLRVGASAGTAEEFSVHEAVLKETSGFFQAAVKKEWKEGSQRVIDLPEDAPEVVSAYVDWLYSDKIFPRTGEPPADTDAHGKESKHLAKLYVFGEKNQDDAFCDAVITAWARHFARKIDGRCYYFTSSSIVEIYRGTSSSSPARKFVVHVFAKHGCKSWLQNEASFTQTALLEFLRDLAIEILRDGGSGPTSDDIFNERRKWFKQK